MCQSDMANYTCSASNVKTGQSHACAGAHGCGNYPPVSRHNVFLFLFVLFVLINDHRLSGMAFIIKVQKFKTKSCNRRTTIYLLVVVDESAEFFI